MAALHQPIAISAHSLDDAPMLLDFLKICIPLLVVIDPAGVLPVYVAMTDRYSQAQRRAIARRATLVAMATGVVFVIVGQAIFRVLGVGFADFQIAGGLLVFILAVIDILTPGKPAVDEKQAVTLDSTVGVVPLAVPLIVGPATMATSLLLVNQYGPNYEKDYGTPLGSIIVVAMVCVALILNLTLLCGAMWHSDLLVKLVGRSTMTVINKIVMILLAAIAVSLIRAGVASIVADLGRHPIAN